MPTNPVNVSPVDVDIPSNGSFLSYEPSQVFRENLILLNLKPYTINGINSEPQGTINYQQTQPDLSSLKHYFFWMDMGHQLSEMKILILKLFHLFTHHIVFLRVITHKVTQDLYLKIRISLK